MVHKILRQARELKREEKYAPKDYQKLRRLVVGKTDKRMISGIIRQEKQHFKKMNKLIHKYTKIGKRIKKHHLKDID